MDERRILLSRIRDLMDRCREQNYLTHTDFLSEGEIAEILHALSGNPQNRRGILDQLPYLLYGGYPEAERCLLIFLPDYLGYEDVLGTELWEEMREEEIPEACFSDGTASVHLREEKSGMRQELLREIRIRAKAEKFGEQLSHRDYLGVLMKLGIKREKLGDILVAEDGKSAELFCLPEMAELICRELGRVRHTTVLCEMTEQSEYSIRKKRKELHLSVSGERLDAVLSSVFRLSRGRAQEAVQQELVMVNGRICSHGDKKLSAGDTVSLRRFGKFCYDGIESSTKKGRFYVRVQLYL